MNIEDVGLFLAIFAFVVILILIPTALGWIGLLIDVILIIMALLVVRKMMGYE